MLKDFLDLQLFALEDGTTEDTEIEGTVDESVEDTSPDQTDENNDFDYALDEDGNLVTNDNETPDDEEQPDAEDEVVPPEPAKVKVKVNGIEEEVSIEELTNGYLRQSDYTRKTQELAEQRRVLEQLPKQETPKQEPAKPKIDTEVIAKAKNAVKEAFNEDFDFLNEEHQAVYMLALQDGLVDKKLGEIKQKELQDSYSSMIQDYQEKEPNFKDIDTYAKERLMELPAKEYLKVMDAIKDGKVSTIKSYLEDTRTEWYKKQNGVEPAKIKNKQEQPPKLESAGVGDLKVKPKTRNINDFKGKDFDSQTRMLQEWGLV